jgi:hypothetical protein
MLSRMIKLIGFVAILMLAASVAAKPPPGKHKPPDSVDEHDHNQSWTFVLVTGLPGEVDNFKKKYKAAYTPGSLLDQFCWEPQYLVDISPPYPSIYTSVGFNCDPSFPTISAIGALLIQTASDGVDGQLTATFTATNPCSGMKCQIDFSTNCTQYTCYGQATCSHYGLPCIHPCK